jgi:hypothetical protein
VASLPVTHLIAALALALANAAAPADTDPAAVAAVAATTELELQGLPDRELRQLAVGLGHGFLAASASLSASEGLAAARGAGGYADMQLHDASGGSLAGAGPSLGSSGGGLSGRAAILSVANSEVTRRRNSVTGSEA